MLTMTDQSEDSIVTSGQSEASEELLETWIHNGTLPLGFSHRDARLQNVCLYHEKSGQK